MNLYNGLESPRVMCCVLVFLNPAEKAIAKARARLRVGEDRRRSVGYIKFVEEGWLHFA